MPRKRHRQSTDFETFSAADLARQETESAPSVHRHVEYTTSDSDSARISTQKAFVTTTTSPSLASPVPPSSLLSLDNVDDSDTSFVGDVFQDEVITEADVDFAHELADMDPSLKQRRRTAGVRYYMKL